MMVGQKGKEKAKREARKCPLYFSRELSHLIGMCMERSEHKRPSAKELLLHRFFVRFPPSKDDLKNFLKQGRQARVAVSNETSQASLAAPPTAQP